MNRSFKKLKQLQAPSKHSQADECAPRPPYNDRECCTDRNSYRHALALLITKISSADPGHPCLAALSDNFAHGTLIRRGNGKRANGSIKCSRLILPWHPGLACLNRIFKDQFHDQFIEAGFDNHIPVVTWRLGAPNIHSRILKDTRFKFSSGRS